LLRLLIKGLDAVQLRTSQAFIPAVGRYKSRHYRCIASANEFIYSLIDRRPD